VIPLTKLTLTPLILLFLAIYSKEAVMAYVYEHYRADTGELFYVGIGKDAFRKRSSKNRNERWHNVVADAGGFYVETIADGISWDEACEMEIALIREHGRACYGEGPLVNITAGGDGWVAKHSEESKEKMRIANSTPEKVAKAKEALKLAVAVNTGKRKVLSLVSHEELVEMTKHLSTQAIANKLNLSHNAVADYLKEHGLYKRYNNLQSLSEEHKERIREGLNNSPAVQRQRIPVVQLTRGGEVVAEHLGIAEAARAIGKPTRAGDISSVVKGKRKTAYGYKWQLKSEI